MLKCAAGCRISDALPMHFSGEGLSPKQNILLHAEYARQRSPMPFGGEGLSPTKECLHKYLTQRDCHQCLSAVRGFHPSGLINHCCPVAQEAVLSGGGF